MVFIAMGGDMPVNRNSRLQNRLCLLPHPPDVKRAQYVKKITLKETLIFLGNKPIFLVYLRNVI